MYGTFSHCAADRALDLGTKGNTVCEFKKEHKISLFVVKTGMFIIYTGRKIKLPCGLHFQDVSNIYTDLTHTHT